MIVRRLALVVGHQSHKMTESEIFIDALDPFAQRSRDATAVGAQAFARLLALAEQRDSGQIRRVAQFIAATYNGRAFTFDLFDLRALDLAISDDVLRCIAAFHCASLRWGRAGLCALVPDGNAGVRSVIDRWGLPWPADG